MAFNEQRRKVFARFMDESTNLSGGLAEPIKKFRTVEFRTYKNRSEMIKRLSDVVFLRATTVGWCTNDQGGCIGGEGLERARCGDCAYSIIDHTKLPTWEGIYEQQIELLDITDLGAVASARVQRDLSRCQKVIAELRS
ncbi:hypothetical protein D9M68_754690 [compost metagenome]